LMSFEEALEGGWLMQMVKVGAAEPVVVTGKVWWVKRKR